MVLSLNPQCNSPSRVNSSSENWSIMMFFFVLDPLSSIFYMSGRCWFDCCACGWDAAFVDSVTWFEFDLFVGLIEPSLRTRFVPWWFHPTFIKPGWKFQSWMKVGWKFTRSEQELKLTNQEASKRASSFRKGISSLNILIGVSPNRSFEVGCRWELPSWWQLVQDKQWKMATLAGQCLQPPTSNEHTANLLENRSCAPQTCHTLKEWQGLLWPGWWQWFAAKPSWRWRCSTTLGSGRWPNLSNH